MKYYGYAGTVLRINLSKRKIAKGELEKDLIVDFLGGRGFNSERLFEEIPRGLDPLSPENKLMFATGPLVGTMFPTASRFNVSAKSPLTGILGDSNAGGHFAAEMKYAGYDQIIIEGRSPDPVYIFVDDDIVRIEDARHLCGRDVYEVDKILREDLKDSSVRTAIVGPAAENGVKFAGIFADLMRAAARTGMGTVMASKRVKALVLRGSKPVEVASPERFMKISEEIEDAIYRHPQYWPRVKMGTTRILTPVNEMGLLPTRHFTAGVFESAADVSGERLAEKYNVKSRGCFSCNIPCSRFYNVREGKFAGLKGEGPEYEALSAFTARVGNADLPLALKANDLVNKLGLDALTTAECISWAMECYAKGWLSKEAADGLDLSWGNGGAILVLIEKIANRQGFGDVLGDGVRAACQKLGFGEEIAMHIKGLEMIQADPRGLKGYGLGFAVATRGGDHLRAEPFIELSDDPRRGTELFGVPEATRRLEWKGKGKLVSYFENWCAVIDALEVCKNIAENMEVLPFAKAAEAIHAATGLDIGAKAVAQAGERIVNVERAFLVREGITRKDDTMPSRFLREPFTSGNSKGSVFELEPMLNEYYAERGWELHTGIPTERKLEELDLGHIAREICAP